MKTDGAIKFADGRSLWGDCSKTCKKGQGELARYDHETLSIRVQKGQDDRDDYNPETARTPAIIGGRCFFKGFEDSVEEHRTCNL